MIVNKVTTEFHKYQGLTNGDYTPLEKHEKTLSCFLYGKTEKPRNTALTLYLALLMQQGIMGAEV